MESDVSEASWRSIEPLSSDWPDYASPELPTLSRLWSERRDALIDRGLVERFNSRLTREWAIETGVIEGLYSLDCGTTNLLIEHGFDEALISHESSDKPAADVIDMIEDHRLALDDIFAFVSGQEPLTNMFIRSLHERLTRNQLTTTGRTPAGLTVEVELLHGEWKRQSNNPTRPGGALHVYCPPFEVQAEMDRLIDNYRSYSAEGVGADVLSAWLHHRFTQIHPFQDGNGRVARALGSISLLQAGWFPLTVRRDDREIYITALEMADAGDLAPLSRFISKGQQRQFLRALTLAQELDVEHQSVRDILAAVVERVSGSVTTEEIVGKAQEMAGRLAGRARARLEELSTVIRGMVGSAMPNLRLYVDTSGPDDSYWYRGDTIDIARQLDYFASSQAFHAWTRLSLKLENSHYDLVVAFAPVGRIEFGVMAASAYAKHRLRNGSATPPVLTRLSNEAFQFNGLDEDRDEATTKRFESWLKDIEIAGLEHWRKTL